MTASQVPHPVPGPPMRSSALDPHPVEVTRYWVSEAMVICWCRVTPSATGLDEEEVDVVGAVPGAGQDDQRRGRGGEGDVALWSR